MSATKLHQLSGMAIVILIIIAAPLISVAAEISVNSTDATFPNLQQAQLDIAELNKKITQIEEGYEKELADARKQVNRQYSEKLDTLKKAQQEKLESAEEFKARIDKSRDELGAQRDSDLAKLDASMSADKETTPIKARVKALSEHLYTVNEDGIETELGKYDIDKHRLAVKFRSKSSVLRLSLDGTIPIQAEAAEELKRQWQSGAVKPEARVKFSGEWVELALVNDTDKTRWFELKEEFYTLATLKTFPPVTLNTLLQIGRHFQDCPACPDMIVIPAGSFDMGSNEEEDEKPVHSIAIGFPFAMGKTEVTQGEWKAIMGSNPGNFKNCGDTCPVEQVSWDDAKDFVQKLSVKTGKQYRLPSEAEWEYACRAGGRLKYCGGDIVDKLAWYNKNSGEHSHAAATKSANAWGLYDMSGNVWEWVEDSYHADYNGAPSDGTAWQGDGSQRVLRGGSWNLAPELERVSIRTGGVPVLRDFYYGFRVVRVLP